MAHAHNHGTGNGRANERRMLLAVTSTSNFMLAEFTGGIEIEQPDCATTRRTSMRKADRCS